MSDVIEVSKSARASCRACREKIAKDVLRFGEEEVNAFSGDGGLSLRWHHMECAAKRVPAKLKAAIDAYSGEITNKAELLALIAAPPRAGGAKANYPYAERASTSRSKCMQCDEAIEKGTWRVAVEREVDTGAFVTKGPGYLHPGCAVEYTDNEDLLAQIKAHMSLSPADVAELEAAFS
jgi:hypothetical protein